MQRRPLLHGFSLVEFMVTVVVIAILAAAAFPSMTDFFDRKRVIGQAEAISNLIQFARSEAVKHPTSASANLVSATFNPGPPWFVGLSSNGAAGCSDAATCVLNEGGTPVTRYLTATECTGCTMTSAAATIVFDLRGMVTGGADEAITIQSPQGKQLSITVSAIGRLSVCSPSGSVKGYPSC
jgi:type IV fimbrial biogenesis protein FimT